MASLADLQTAVDRLFRVAGTSTLIQLNRRTKDSAYEAYIFGLCIEAVRRLGGLVQIRTVSGQINPNPIILRGAPGVIYSTLQDYAHAYCVLNGKAFEIHLDVEFIGQSTASHEIDVSFIWHDVAERCRVRTEYPRMSQHLIGAIECKFYSGNPGVMLARTFAGLVSDSSANRVEAFAYNRSSDEIAAFFSKVNSSECFDELTPLNKNYEEMFINYVMKELKKWSKRKN